MQHRQATGRATLAPVARTKSGKTFWSARGQIPVRQADGAIGSRRVERGFGPDITTEAQRYSKCAEWNQEYEERFRNPKRLITFARAYTNYIGKGHPVPLKATQILEAIGTEQCADIDDTMMDELTEELWPDGAMAGTINRHLYSPVISILHIALKEKAPRLQRPKGHRDVTPVIIPPESWYRELAPSLNPTQLAFVMMMAMHGRRTREFLSRKPADLNVETGNFDLGKTKTGVRQLELHPKCVELIQGIKGWDKRKWLFGCGPNSANSFRRDLKAACVRAEIKWYHPHSFGRHTSVTRMLRAGFSVAHVADAHGMTPEMVTRRYGHLTKKETTAGLHQVGGELYDRTFGGGIVGDGEGKINGHTAPVSLIEHKKDELSAAPEMLPSEGDALSICATGADEKYSKYGVSTLILDSEQDETRQEQTGDDGGSVGIMKE